MVPSSAAEKARSLTARAGDARTTLRRVVSDSDLKEAAKGMRTAGRLKAAATVSVAFNRMRALAEAAKKERTISHKRVYVSILNHTIWMRKLNPLCVWVILIPRYVMANTAELHIPTGTRPSTSQNYLC